MFGFGSISRGYINASPVVSRAYLQRSMKTSREARTIYLVKSAVALIAHLNSPG
jgi:hypothetical protein